MSASSSSSRQARCSRGAKGVCESEWSGADRAISTARWKTRLDWEITHALEQA